MYGWPFNIVAMRLLQIVLVVFTATVCFGVAPEGIPRELARERADLVSDLHYNLRFSLTPHAPTAGGHEELSFQLKSVRPLLLDFRDGTASNLVINNSATPVVAENGHIVLPAEKLHVGNNVVVMDFTAPVA